MPKASKRDLTNLSENELLFLLLGEKLNAIDPYNVFYTNKRAKPDGTFDYVYILNSKVINQAQLANLKQEAKAMVNMELFKIITVTLRETAKKTMFEKSTDYDGMKAGKATLYTISVIETIVNNLLKAQLSPVSPVGEKK